ncbi:hypothetical protein IPM19_03730 [bacterium]|nr:MAG: hypothetical protein IPM19_03730 [bacterium]
MLRQEQTSSRAEKVSEETIRAGVLSSLLKQPQHIYINVKQQRLFLSPEGKVDLKSVPLRERVLATGEKVIILTDTSEYSAAVISAVRCKNATQLGQTDIVVQRC